ncbi:MAG: S-layer homology domain-containing protein [Firmicutes bacterium]|nr:S-layer homology domain-containing protein [Bacillota bacterium]
MKNKKIKWLSIPLAIVLLLALSVAGFSALTKSDNPTVMLDGKARDFVVTNAATAPNGNADLFVDMKDLMPGDSVTETVTVGVDDFDELQMKNVTIFAEAVKGSETGDYQKIVGSKYVKFTVKQGDKEITVPLGDGVSLATFSDDGSVDLDVTLSIDKQAGNELSDLMGTIDWHFYLQSGPVLNTDDHFAYIIGYPDGTVRPDRQISRAEVATIYFRLLTEDSRQYYMSSENDFSDVKTSDWFNRAISTLANAGILTGYPDGTFKPNAPITRAEMATIAAKFDIVTDSDVEVTKSFSDIKGHWAEKYILRAASRGWVNGYPDGTFRPDRNITRAEAMKLVNYVLGRVVNEAGLDPIKGSPYYNEWIDNVKISGTDNANANPWYYYHIQEATNSHDYYRTELPVADLQGVYYEEWFVVEKAPDWAALEKTW